MGNIRPTYIKRIAIELVQKYPEQFTSDFQHNKLMVSKLTDVRYVAMRNKIAGYVTGTGHTTRRRRPCCSVLLLRTFL